MLVAHGKADGWHFRGWAVGAVAALAIGGAPGASAQGNGAEASVAQSEREAVFALSRLGLEERDYRFPVTYCPHNADECQQAGYWDVELTQDYADEVLADQMATIVPARYDRIVAKADETRIETATDVFREEGDWMPAYTFGVGGYERFESAVTDYLNAHIAEPLADVLTQARDARYEEMPDKEQATFIKERARETGIPADVLERLVTSAYTFSFFLPEIRDGAFTIYQQQRTRPDGSTYYVYETELEAPVNPRLTVYRFDGERFEPMQAIDAAAEGVFERIAKSVSGTASVTRESRPRQSDAQAVFNEVFAVSFKDSVIALTTRLKEESEAFTVGAPISRVDGGRAEVPIGNQESLRPGAVMVVRRHVDGEEQRIGWTKIREVGDTCLVLPEGERTLSKAQVIAADREVERADLLQEYPYTGVYGRGGLGVETTEVELGGEGSGASSPTTYLDLGFQGDLGFILNEEALTRWWSNLDVGLGVSSAGDVDDRELDAGIGLRARAGIERRQHLVQGLYVAAGGDIGVEALRMDYQEGAVSDELSLSSLQLYPRAGLGYHLSPDLKVTGHIGYAFPVWDDYEYESGTGPTAELSGGLNASVSVAYHTDFAGPFADATADPTERCQRLRDAGQEEGENMARRLSAREAVACALSQR